MADGQGVEEFIGNQKQRPVGKTVVELALPGNVRAAAAQLLGLHLLQYRAGLDHHHVQVGNEFRFDRRGAQHVRHQSAASRPQFHKAGILGTALVGPGLQHPKPQHLAEHLADFRRGDEIATSPERIAGGVIAFLGIEQRQGHELRHRHRALGLDQGGDARVQTHAARGFFFTAVQNKAAAPSQIGMDRAMPMVMGPMNWVSGSRKNSQMKRKVP